VTRTISVKDAKPYVGITIRGLYGLIHRNKFPSVPVANGPEKYVIPVPSLILWLELEAGRSKRRLEFLNNSLVKIRSKYGG
jgi:hypothetical protein